jgi:hypothetical protein
MAFKPQANKGLGINACKNACKKHGVEFTPELVYMSGDPMKWGFWVDENGAPCAEPAAEAEVVEFADGGTAQNPFAQLMQKSADAPDAPAAKTGYKIQKDRPEQNGIKQPSTGTLCRRIWDKLDALSAETKSIPQIKPFRDALTAEGVDTTTCTIQFYRWRKFHGVTGRTA